MPSLRKRMSTYLRQLSFHNEPRERKLNTLNENSFINKYLQGDISLKEGPTIIYGKTPTELPNYELNLYDNGPNSIIGCYTGPNGGLTTIKRTEKHLTIEADIDFIDNPDTCTTPTQTTSNNIDILNEKQSSTISSTTLSGMSSSHLNDKNLPKNWRKKCDFIYGISDSLYDKNQITKIKNGEPIADCFGIIARNDSAILTVADGVNWGEKACIAAKSAVHGCLHYLNKTIFNDTQPFDDLVDSTTTPTSSSSSNNNNSSSSSNSSSGENLITNTKDIFVCLLRAFNCAHDLILENQGMLTTLTTAIVLPLKTTTTTTKNKNEFVCCVCNVGDTLAYVYSKNYGIRELTKGSHDINLNRDLRDALGALGPCDGINPELNNLTLSITKLSKGDLIMVASDGLTDNFDPNVCKFTVNCPNKNPTPSSSTLSSIPSTSTSINNKQPQIIETRTSNLRKQQNQLKLTQSFGVGNSSKLMKPQRSKTVIEMRRHPQQSKATSLKQKNILRNEDGLPFVTPIQRYELQLLLIEDIIKNGLNGQSSNNSNAPTTPLINTAKKLCENLMNFVFSITSAKRHTLEDLDLYYENRQGILIELKANEKKFKRKKALEKVQNLPGKLDHITIVAWNVGNICH